MMGGAGRQPCRRVDAAKVREGMRSGDPDPAAWACGYRPCYLADNRSPPYPHCLPRETLPPPQRPFPPTYPFRPSPLPYRALNLDTQTRRGPRALMAPPWPHLSGNGVASRLAGLTPSTSRSPPQGLADGAPGGSGGGLAPNDSELMARVMSVVTLCHFLNFSRKSRDSRFFSPPPRSEAGGGGTLTYDTRRTTI